MVCRYEMLQVNSGQDGNDSAEGLGAVNAEVNNDIQRVVNSNNRSENSSPPSSSDSAIPVPFIARVTRFTSSSNGVDHRCENPSQKSTNCQVRDDLMKPNPGLQFSALPDPWLCISQPLRSPPKYALR